MDRKARKKDGKRTLSKQPVLPPPSASTQASASASVPRWRYDKGGEGGNRLKHKWSEPHAGFVRVGNEVVGKCASNIATEDLERLLNTGIGVDGDDLTPGPRPSKIYIVHQGAVYRAKATNSEANTWHAFPADARELQKLSDETWARILDRATQLGCAEPVAKWKRTAGEMV